MNATKNYAMSNVMETPYPYLTYMFGFALIVSEVLPLLKNKSNGLVHTIICVLKGTSCMTQKLAEVIEKQNAVTEPPV